MFKDSEKGNTNYCNHTTDETICDTCLGSADDVIGHNVSGTTSRRPTPEEIEILDK